MSLGIYLDHLELNVDKNLMPYRTLPHIKGFGNSLFQRMDTYSPVELVRMSMNNQWEYTGNISSMLFISIWFIVH
jgi:hypothetical protein